MAWRVVSSIGNALLILSMTLTGCNNQTLEIENSTNYRITESESDISEVITEVVNDDCENKTNSKLQNNSTIKNETTEITEAVTQEDEIQTISPREQKVKEMIMNMSLHEKVCQMFFVTPESLTGVQQVTGAAEITRKALEEYPVGGIMYSRNNMIDGEQTKEMIRNTQDYAKIGLFIAADEEGGTVNRLMKQLGTTYIGSMYDYRNEGETKAYQNAYTIASDMKAYGFNLDFAPVADVWSNPENTVIGKRAYSDQFDEAATLVAAAVRGFHDGGVMCTLKHFPGHGDTMEDSHEGTAYVTKTKQELEQQEFQPFKSGMEQGADFVMVGHLTVKDIDDMPASLSSKIITGILREELGFQGIVITDGMQMNSIAKLYSSEQMAILAVKAGNDMLLEIPDVKAAVKGIEDAVSNGEISEERIDQSVERILLLKMDKGLTK